MEREKAPQQPFSFPRIYKAELDQFDAKFDMSHMSGEAMVAKMINDDEWVGKFIYAYSANVRDPDVFIECAYYVSEALSEILGKQAKPLPKVSFNTVNTFYLEGKPQSDMINYIRGSDFEKLPPEEKERILKNMYEKADDPTEYIHPDPYNYCEENPALMVKIASFGFTLPGMLVYEFKRRQYLSNQLEERLFQVE